MTNLLEKSLLVGFGAFILVIFSSLIIPLIGEIIEFDKNEKNDLESYLTLVEKIDQGVNYIIDNNDKEFLNQIQYPKDLNITFIDSYIIFNFLIDKNHYEKVIAYDEWLFNNSFYNLAPQIYLLSVSYKRLLINVYFYNLY